MSLKVDHRYAGEVRPGSELIESQSGSLGFQVMLGCEDGDTSYTIWLTAKNRDRARDVFVKALGIDAAKLQNQTYIENQLAIDIAGRPVTFITEANEYKGKTIIKVAWLFSRRSASGNPAKSAAAFFGDVPAKGHDVELPITDDDIPF